MKSLESEVLEKIEKHKAMVFKISKRCMNNLDDQKDLFEERLRIKLKAYPKFEGRNEFSTWLYRIALNMAIVFLKSETKKSYTKK